MGVIDTILGPVMDTINKVVPDLDMRFKIQSELTKQALDAESDLNKSAASIALADADGKSWMQRNWRPTMMFSFVFIIVNNYIVVPYITAFGGHVPTLDIPDHMWTLLTWGSGLYITGRSAETIAPHIAAVLKKPAVPSL